MPLPLIFPEEIRDFVWRYFFTSNMDNPMEKRIQSWHIEVPFLYINVLRHFLGS
ncbi:hypothetical protein PFHG_02209 [Plasmodium falciparum HB3]|uniref:Uncharacterized protein n=1 Tax=Plasmodium falciparum (isolate HB3) TaxID=137071 RepID=A0A0L7KAW8_PLAFX|nr:hypothetical protein PFHG_02209 [Plasmodium falciparum HB3]